MATTAMEVLTNKSVRNLSHLVEHSVFLTVHFGMMGIVRKVRVQDKQEATDTGVAYTGSVQVTTDADAAMLKAQKTLLESDELDAIRKADNAMRTWLKLKCLPYHDVGILILPNEHIALVDAELKEYERTGRPALVDAFVAVYPAKLEEAKEKLGSLFDAGDYVSAENIREVFTFNYDIFSFAVPEALRMVGKYEEQAAKLEERFHVAAEEIEAVMRQSLLDLVSNLSTALTPAEEEGKRKRLHKSALLNINEFLSTFRARNITNDTELAGVVDRLREVIGDTQIEDLRKDDAFKGRMLESMTGLKDQLTKLMVDDAPDRKVRI